jgi:hypothetical protein
MISGLVHAENDQDVKNNMLSIRAGFGGGIFGSTKTTTDTLGVDYLYEFAKILIGGGARYATYNRESSLMATGANTSTKLTCMEFYFSVKKNVLNHNEKHFIRLGSDFGPGIANASFNDQSQNSTTKKNFNYYHASINLDWSYKLKNKDLISIGIIKSWIFYDVVVPEWGTDKLISDSEPTLSVAYTYTY